MRRRTRLPVGCVALVAALLLAPPARRLARADATDACIEANAATQRLRKEQKLLAARVQAAACARESCPALVRKECAAWSRELEAATPKLTVVALDAAGAAVTDAKLFLDGAPLPGGTSGAPHALDPGQHTVRLEREGEPPRTQSIDVHADVRIVFELGPEKKPEPALPTAGTTAGPAPSATSSTTWSPSKSLSSPRPATPESAATLDTRPTPAGVYVLAAVGAAGLTTFAITGTIGKLRYDRLRDECPQCSTSARDDAKTMLRVADLSLVIGVLASGLATYGYLTRPVLTVQPLTQGAAACFTGVF